MSADDLTALEVGRHYLTLIRGQKRRVRRAFKRLTTRFGDISCAVFTTRITRRVATWVNDNGDWCERGPWRELPQGEYNVPHYDLLDCVPVSK
jgi:hypothetical protein